MIPIRVLINGAQGKMGQIAVAAINQAEDFELVAQTGKQDNLQTIIDNSRAQIVIDLTTANAAFANTQIIIQANARPIIGTSGLLPEHINHLTQLCEHKKLGSIIVPNFSIAALLMMKYAEDCVRYFPQVEIIELHHDEKADAPSGTAIKTASMLATAKNKTVPKVLETELLPGARGAKINDINVHSIRLPGLVAHQEIIFGSTGETLTIRHDMLNRQAMIPGILLACRKVMTLNKLIYGLENIL